MKSRGTTLLIYIGGITVDSEPLWLEGVSEPQSGVESGGCMWQAACPQWVCIAAGALLWLSGGGVCCGGRGPLGAGTWRAVCPQSACICADALLWLSGGGGNRGAGTDACGCTWQAACPRLVCIAADALLWLLGGGGSCGGRGPLAAGVAARGCTYRAVSRNIGVWISSASRRALSGRIRSSGTELSWPKPP